MIAPPPHNRLIWVTFFALLALVVGLNVAWHATHLEPMISAFNNLTEFLDQWDEFTLAPGEHLIHVLRQYDEGVHRSLFYLLTGVTVLALGFNRFGVLLISTVSLVVLLASVFGIVRRLRPGAGPLAASLAVLSPAAVFWSRAYSPFIAVMATAAFGVYLLVRSERLSRPLPTLAFGLLAGLALRLPVEVGDAMQFELTFGCTGLYVFVLAMIRPVDGRRKPILFSLAAAAIFALAVNKPFLWHSIRYGYQEAVLLAPTKYAPGSIISDPLALLSHAALLWHHHLGPFLSVITALALAIISWRPKSKEGWGFVFFLVPLVVITLINKKAFYYSFGLLPGAAIVVGLAVGRLKNKAVVAFCFALLLAGLAITNPWSMDTARVTPAHAPINGEWYEQFMEFGTTSQFRSSDNQYPAAQMVDAALSQAEQGHDIDFLYLANMRSASQNTVYRFLLRVAAENPHFTFVDPIRDLERLCMRGIIPAWYRHPRGVPNVILLDGQGTRIPPAADDLVSVAFWRQRFELDNKCLLHNPEEGASPDQIKQRLTELLVGLPWDSFRMRTYDGGPRMFVFDRPDLGISVALPTPRPIDHRRPLP